MSESEISEFRLALVASWRENLCGRLPCIDDGRDMRTAHAKLPIINAHFDALTEDLYIAFDRVGVSYALQNQMIPLLAPMLRDIVKR